MSLKPIPGVGKSGTSRIFDFRSNLSTRDSPQIAPEEELRELLGEARQRLQIFHPGLAALGVARAQRRPDQLLDHACFLPVRKRRSIRGAIPKRASFAHAEAISTSLSP